MLLVTGDIWGQVGPGGPGAGVMPIPKLLRVHLPYASTHLFWEG